MIKMSKGAITAISLTSAGIIAGSTVLANLAMKESSQQDKKVNPLDRDSNFHHYTIVNKIAANTNLNNLIDTIKKDNVLIYCISEAKFLANFKSIVRDVLKDIPTFSQKYLGYTIECNYKIKNTKSILIDLVWYEPGNKTKFYDQLELVLLDS